VKAGARFLLGGLAGLAIGYAAIKLINRNRRDGVRLLPPPRSEPLAGSRALKEGEEAPGAAESLNSAPDA
jgi:hypothetical protein